MKCFRAIFRGIYVLNKRFYAKKRNIEFESIFSAAALSSKTTINLAMFPMTGVMYYLILVFISGATFLFKICHRATNSHVNNPLIENVILFLPSYSFQCNIIAFNVKETVKITNISVTIRYLHI